ncbi:hypothetical protein DLAC_07393 [Tieghemostelium lacteum]|uniref:Uncharacterized protein n=1 Tax=Tieghemostelium lacteum TaxID=361077 RepID=A0A151ZCE7_TIELA|nr:hypothetical protein DLAC_07393 [Tieghemostelium lacteum]|eukprot:KYQ91622.1 hypothetical protein DLAC_07393 [Tieghemostelium lacteum]
MDKMQTEEFIHSSIDTVNSLNQYIKDNVSKYPLLDNLFEEFTTSLHLFERSLPILLLNDDEITRYDNMKFEFDHILESVCHRMLNIPIYYQKVRKVYNNHTQLNYDLFTCDKVLRDLSELKRQFERRKEQLNNHTIKQAQRVASTTNKTPQFQNNVLSLVWIFLIGLVGVIVVSSILISQNQM